MLRRPSFKAVMLAAIVVFCIGGGIAQNITADNSSQPNLEGIWRLSLGQAVLSMVLYQFEGQLFGSASSAEESWNGVVMGQINDSNIELAITFMKGGMLLGIKLIGSYADEEMRGTFYRADSMGNTASGEFDAILINPDTFGYTPVEEKHMEEAKETSEQTIPVQADTSNQSSDSGSRYIDVHSLAHLVPPAAGVIPPGISMGGAGGMGMMG